MLGRHDLPFAWDVQAYPENDGTGGTSGFTPSYQEVSLYLKNMVLVQMVQAVAGRQGLVGRSMASARVGPILALSRAYTVTPGMPGTLRQVFRSGILEQEQSLLVQDFAYLRTFEADTGCLDWRGVTRDQN